MPVYATRIPPRLLARLAAIDDPRVPIAETNRRLGREAERMGITRPSYERVRVLVHRLRRRGARPPRLALSWRVALRAPTRELVIEHVARVGFRRLE